MQTRMPNASAHRLTCLSDLVHIIPKDAIRVEIIIARTYRVVQLAALCVLVEYDGKIVILLVHLEKLIKIIFRVERSGSYGKRKYFGKMEET